MTAWESIKRQRAAARRAREEEDRVLPLQEELQNLAQENLQALVLPGGRRIA
jgi:hypothetical protein